MGSSDSFSCNFQVWKSKPELVGPAKPTPHELKQLSDIDEHLTPRFQTLVVNFYRCNPLMTGRDPAKIVKEALAQALVWYYPLAGRLREMADGKLVVDCTGEGVLFIEADADATLDHFANPFRPPFPYMDELLYDVPGSQGILDSPLLLFQVMITNPERLSNVFKL